MTEHLSGVDIPVEIGVSEPGPQAEATESEEHTVEDVAADGISGLFP